MTKDYNRTTRECAFADLHPDLGAAIQRHACAQSLGDIHAAPLICIQTESERVVDRRLYGPAQGESPDPRHYTAAVVTPDWLVWAMTGGGREPTAFSARLSTVLVRDYDLQAMVEDDGLIITAPARGTPYHSSAFLGLAPGETADKFKTVLRAAIKEIKSPRQ